MKYLETKSVNWSMLRNIWLKMFLFEGILPRYQRKYVNIWISLRILTTLRSHRCAQMLPEMLPLKLILKRPMPRRSIQEFNAKNINLDAHPQASMYNIPWYVQAFSCSPMLTFSAKEIRKQRKKSQRLIFSLFIFGIYILKTSRTPSRCLRAKVKITIKRKPKTKNKTKSKTKTQTKPTICTLLKRMSHCVVHAFVSENKYFRV